MYEIVLSGGFQHVANRQNDVANRKNELKKVFFK